MFILSRRQAPTPSATVRSKALPALLGAAIILAMSHASFAADSFSYEVDSLDRRAELRGWEGVGRLDMRGNTTCSGALIAEDLVLTAAHCLVRDDGSEIAPEDIIFRAGLRHGEHIAISRGLKVAIPDAYKRGAPNSAAQIRQDVALIKLAKPISRSLASSFALHSALLTGGNLTVASYGRGRNSALSLQRQCNILSLSKDIYDFDCDITYGSSGAPVFALDSGNRKRIVSVVSSLRTRGDVKTGRGMVLLDIVPALRRKLATGSTSPGAVAAEARHITVGESDGTRSVGGSRFITVK